MQPPLDEPHPRPRLRHCMRRVHYVATCCPVLVSRYTDLIKPEFGTAAMTTALAFNPSNTHQFALGSADSLIRCRVRTRPCIGWPGWPDLLIPHHVQRDTPGRLRTHTPGRLHTHTHTHTHTRPCTHAHTRPSISTMSTAVGGSCAHRFLLQIHRTPCNPGTPSSCVHRVYDLRALDTRATGRLQHRVDRSDCVSAGLSLPARSTLDAGGCLPRATTRVHAACSDWAVTCGSRALRREVLPEPVDAARTAQRVQRRRRIGHCLEHCRRALPCPAWAGQTWRQPQLGRTGWNGTRHAPGLRCAATCRRPADSLPPSLLFRTLALAAVLSGTCGLRGRQCVLQSR